MLTITSMSQSDPASSTSAIEFLRNLVQMAERLASDGIVVRSLTSAWSHMGSWEIMASNGAEEDRSSASVRAGDYHSAGPRVVYVTWDGRERLLESRLVPTTN